MLRIRVVLPQPDGPSSPVIEPRGDRHREVVQRDPFTADHAQILDTDGRLSAARR